MSDEDEDEDTSLVEPSWMDQVQPVRFLELFEKYRRRMVHRETGLPFDPTRAKAAPYTLEGLAFETGAGLRLALKVFFPICAAVFVLTFIWDLHAVVRSCAVAGMIGFGTNWVAIKMLFWPRERRPIFGHGLIPSQRDQLIDKVANEVLEKLINEELIFQKIEEARVVARFTEGLIERLRVVIRQDEFKQDLRNMLLTYVGELTSNPEFRERIVDRAEETMEELAGQNFRLWMVSKLKEVWRAPLIEVINREIENLDETVDTALEGMDNVLERLPSALEKRQAQIDRVLTTMLMGLVREVDVRAIVFEQLATVTPQQLEEGFREFSDDKLSFITLLGGLLGVVGGTVIIWPLPSLAVLLVLGAVMAAVDVAIYPLMASRYWPQREASGAPEEPDAEPPEPPSGAVAGAAPTGAEGEPASSAAGDLVGAGGTPDVL